MYCCCGYYVWHQSVGRTTINYQCKSYSQHGGSHLRYRVCVYQAVVKPGVSFNVLFECGNIVGLVRFWYPKLNKAWDLAFLHAIWLVHCPAMNYYIVLVWWLSYDRILYRRLLNVCQTLFILEDEVTEVGAGMQVDNTAVTCSSQHKWEMREVCMLYS